MRVISSGVYGTALFDRVLAMVPGFGLRVCQAPVGSDLRQWLEKVEAVSTAMEHSRRDRIVVGCREGGHALSTQLDMALAESALEDLLESEERVATPEVSFEVGNTCLASSAYGAEAASAVLAATGCVAADVNALRGSHSISRIDIDTRLAEASLLSFALQSFSDQTKAPPTRLPPEDRTSAAGFFACRDGGVVYLHSSFPGYSEHSDAIRRLLGASADRESVVRAVGRLSAPDLEERIAAAGLCGAMVRTASEWDESAPGVSLARVPVVEVLKTGDGSRGDFPVVGEKPLHGMRVLDLTRVLAGPACARTLSSYGADVLHVRGPDLPFLEAFVVDTGLGKRSAFLDLKASGDCATLRDLVKQSHVFSQGYRSGAMERLGFGVEAVTEMNPDIIYVSTNCYGHEGEWCQRPGWEQLAQVVTGMAARRGNELHPGEGDAKPELQPSALNDYTTGYLAALGVLLAKRRQLIEGGSYWVRVSLCRTAMWIRGLGSRPGRIDPQPPGGRELEGWVQEFETAWGGLACLKPAVSLDGSPLLWPSPPVPLGTHPAEFRSVGSFP